jgi:hypothetical protein
MMKRMKNILGRRGVGLALAFTLLACVAAQARQEQKFAQAQQENAKRLRQYSWKSRTEVRKDGETKSTQMYLLQYDADGAVQQTLVSSTSPKLPTRGLRGFVAKKKKEEFVELLDGLRAVAKSYGGLAPEKMQRFMAGASVTPEQTARGNLVRLQGRDVLQPGDSMIVWLDAATRRQRRVEVETTFKGKPVRIVSEFQDLTDGPTYVARAVVEYPSRELTITTENFDYTRAQR